MAFGKLSLCGKNQLDLGANRPDLIINCCVDSIFKFILGSKKGSEKVQTETVSSELLEESSKRKSVVAGVQVIVSIVIENGLNIFHNI